jgi:hypothetical protein
MLTKEASSPILGNAVAGCRRDDCVEGVVVCDEYSAAPSPAKAAAQIWHATDASFDLVVMVYEEVVPIIWERTLLRRWAEQHSLRCRFR